MPLLNPDAPGEFVFGKGRVVKDGNDIAIIANGATQTITINTQGRIDW